MIKFKKYLKCRRFICLLFFMIKTRIAPSPTGNMHIWTARAALFNYIFAKQQNWKFLIRVEDTDKERSLQAHTHELLAWLSWLGFKHDEQIVFQSKNEELHQQAVQKLIEDWFAYYAWESAEELEKMREKAREQKQGFVYRQRKYTEEELEKYKKENRKPVVRFKVNDETLVYEDMVKWKISFDMSLVSDFVIQKSDWSPIFYIANVVDDNLQQITHVIRWEDHIPNVPKQILLYHALGYNLPIFWHLPLLLNSNKSKMSKRDSGEIFVTVKKFMQEWFLRQAVINFIALMWWHTCDDREFFSMQDLLKEFSFDRVQSSNAVYDFQRAIFFNTEHIRNLSNEEFIQEIKDYVEILINHENFKTEDENLLKKAKYWQNIINSWKLDNMEYANKRIPELKIRLQTLKQFVEYSTYLFDYQQVEDEILYNPKMKVDQEIVKIHLPKIIELLSNLNDRTDETLKEVLISYNKQNDLKNGQTLWPIRSILSWVAASPGAFELMLILWKEETLQRLKNFI